MNQVAHKDMQTAPKRPSPKEPRRTQNAQASELLAAQQAVLLRACCELLDEAELQAALMAFTDELARRFKCERVAVGIAEDDTITVRAVSGHASFDKRATEIEHIRCAMQEACDQDAQIHWHRQLDSDAQSRWPSHRLIAAANSKREVCTVPLFAATDAVGAVLFLREADQPWSAKTTSLIRQLGALAAPIVSLRLRNEAPLLQRLRRHAASGVGKLFGRKGLTSKALLALLIIAIGATSIWPTDAVVGADAELLPQERRVISAPFASYVREVYVESGDLVASGDLLVALDTRDLDLEKTKLENEMLSHRAEFRAAMANRERKDMAITQARQQQTEARIALVDARLERAQIRAPHSGVVVAGELRQVIGAPVERGDPLAEIAPPDGYKAVLWVDEQDVSRVSIGQTGTLSMRASPADGISLRVTDIHPIATPGGGANRFRVEAQLSENPSGLRPGHTGYGKIVVGETTALRAWTHRFWRWFQQMWWEWFA